MTLHAAHWLWDAPVVLAATPIGNLSDATDRLKQLISTADVIACEDTRSTGRLIQSLAVSTEAQLISLHEHNEASRSAELVERAGAGERILVVSDAGMPAVSDPGHRLVSAAVKAGVSVTAAPGASAVTTALVLSGLATGQFTFGGFFPRKHSDQNALITRLRNEEWTTVVFESPHRIAATVELLSAELGQSRQAAIARELTKKYEEVLRGSLGELQVELTRRQSVSRIKGEFVLVLGGVNHNAETEQLSLEEAAGLVIERSQKSGQRLKAVAKELAATAPYSASELYDAATRVIPR